MAPPRYLSVEPGARGAAEVRGLEVGEQVPGLAGKSVAKPGLLPILGVVLVARRAVAQVLERRRRGPIFLQNGEEIRPGVDDVSHPQDEVRLPRARATPGVARGVGLVAGRVVARRPRARVVCDHFDSAPGIGKSGSIRVRLGPAERRSSRPVDAVVANALEAAEGGGAALEERVLPHAHSGRADLEELDLRARAVVVNRVV